MQEFDMLMILSEKTNRIAHGLTTLLSQQEFEQPLMTAYALIKKWGAS
ncbi:hypothetical protein [Methylocucumis oryzae]|nr:hypothetical protein [Methylocucumis oryzae]